MRGADTFTESSLLMREDFVLASRPLRAICKMVNTALAKMDALFSRIGLSMEDEVWVSRVFTKNRGRVIEHDAVIEFFNEVLKIAGKKYWLSSERFSVDGTFIQAWAGHKSFCAQRR